MQALGWAIAGTLRVHAVTRALPYPPERFAVAVTAGASGIGKEIAPSSTT
jgi:hypothetical protein